MVADPWSNSSFHLPGVLWAVDSSLCLIQVTGRDADLFGLDPQRSLGQTLQQLFPQPTAEIHTKHHLQTLLGIRPPTKFSGSNSTTGVVSSLCPPPQG
ncbi:MAG: hypothetical protein HC921_11055 [Synechococcaceae cyanobacterium SM2_3_1]|nr:hypothetical protein [Synechococcaceae cyanobacterium SM2_3_1]